MGPGMTNIMPHPSTSEQQLAHYHQVKEIIQAEDFWERVPEHARDFSPDNLENLVLQLAGTGTN